MPDHTQNTLAPPGLQPDDEHTRVLLANVHPPDWTNPQPVPRYNLVVIGAGTAGLVTAAGAAGLGAKVALLERHLLGGDCLNAGCVPSKCIIGSARRAADFRDAAAFGIQVRGEVDVDFAAVMDRMRRLRADISPHDAAGRFRALGVDVFFGDARFTAADTVAVGGQTLRFARAVIATGARAAVPAVAGFAETGFLTNETVFSLTERPRRLACLGAGPIGCEMAQAFQRLGCEVVLLDTAPHVLAREDTDAAGVLQHALQRDGVRIILEAQLTRVERRNGEKVLHYTTNGRSAAVTVDEILVATGRTPHVNGLNLEAAGVRYTTETGIAVDDHLQTTNPRIFAAGDVCMRWQFTHAADAAARLVIQNALFGYAGKKRLSTLIIPWCTYTDPEIAHVGLSEHTAREQNIPIDTFVRPLAEVDRAVVDGETDGFVKIHVKQGSDRIVGATIVARHAGEMIGEITAAMVGGLGLGTLATVIHPYPTQAEAIRQAADAYNRTRLTPLLKSLFTKYLAWARR